MSSNIFESKFVLEFCMKALEKVNKFLEFMLGTIKYLPVKKKISLILNELLLQGQGHVFSDSDDEKVESHNDIDRDFFHGHGIASSLSI